MNDPEYPPPSEAHRKIKAELIKAIHAVPFRPFTIRRDDGRRYPITHPELAMLSPYGWSCVITVPGTGALALLPLRILAGIEYPLARPAQARRDP